MSFKSCLLISNENALNTSAISPHDKIEQFCSADFRSLSAPLRKFEQFPAQKMYQNLRWPAQILTRSPRWTSAIPALGRASLAPSVGEMDELFMAAEQKNGQKNLKILAPIFSSASSPSHYYTQKVVPEVVQRK